MGGILILAAIIISTLLTGNLKNQNVLLCIITLIGFGLLGFLDDYIKDFFSKGKGISSRFKFFTQIVLATIIAVYLFYFNPNEYLLGKNTPAVLAVTSIYIPFLNNVSVNIGLFYIPFAVFLIVGFSNAVNITDGLDGLAIGLTLFTVLAFTTIAYLSGHRQIAEYLKIPFSPQVGEITVFTGAIAGACLGFLWFNSHPAQIFMGDTGSLSLGGIIAVIALLLKNEIIFGVIGGVFVIETASVILQVLSFRLRGKRIFKMAPIHHHFEILGYPENKIILRMWIVGAVCALTGIASLKIW